MTSAASIEDVVDYVIENGIDKFRSTHVKEDNKEIYNYISKIGGFRKFRDDCINGKYDVYFKERGVNTSSGVIPIAKEVYEPVKNDRSENNPKQVFDDKTSEVLDEILKTQKELIAKVDTIIPMLSNEITRMHEKLQTIEGDMVDNIRKSIIGMVKKYAAIMYSDLNSTDSIRRAYRDMYDEFDNKYGINIEGVQLAYIKNINFNRIKNGKPPIDYIDNNGRFKKIDIIEKLGMLTEFYILIKSKLDNIISE